MARIYHRDQPGAPEVTYGTNTSGPHHFESFKTILKASLINGYDIIPAAGWELIFESTNSLVLRTGTHSGYVCFQRDSSYPTVVTVWLAATFAGVDAYGKILGDGARSGLAADSSDPQRISLRAFTTYSVSCTWYVAADPATFVFSLSGSRQTSEREATEGEGYPYEANYTLYCGEDSGGDMISIGGLNTSGTSSSTTSTEFSSSGFSLLKYPDTGLLVDTNRATVQTPGLVIPPSSAMFIAYREIPTGVIIPDVSLSQFSWICNGVVRKLRGLVIDPRLAFTYNSLLSQALGGPALTTRTMNTSIDLGDGHEYMVARTYYYYAVSMLLTTNPEFW